MNESLSLRNRLMIVKSLLNVKSFSMGTALLVAGGISLIVGLVSFFKYSDYIVSAVAIALWLGFGYVASTIQERLFRKRFRLLSKIYSEGSFHVTDGYQTLTLKNYHHYIDADFTRGLRFDRLWIDSTPSKVKWINGERFAQVVEDNSLYKSDKGFVPDYDNASGKYFFNLMSKDSIEYVGFKDNVDIERILSKLSDAHTGRMVFKMRSDSKMKRIIVQGHGEVNIDSYSIEGVKKALKMKYRSPVRAQFDGDRLVLCIKN